MSIKIVYVLVGTDKDIYLEQAFVSMWSVRRYMTDAHIAVLVDKLTQESLLGKRQRMMQYADEVVVIDLDESLSGQMRSRLLKTGLRNHVDGDYLFIDCDTIVARPFDWEYLKTLDCDIAACVDTHTCLMSNPYRDLIAWHGRLLGWDVMQEPEYFNSGVIFVRDNEATHSFYKKWNENYLKGIDVGVFMDQPSFAKTNNELGHPVKCLPDIWNCELKHGIRFLKDAYVVHYLCTSRSDGKNVQFFAMNDMRYLDEIKQTAEIPDYIKEIVDNPFNGIAPLTHCFAGEDVMFFASDFYHKMRRTTPFDRKMICLYIRIHEKLGRIKRTLMWK